MIIVSDTSPITGLICIGELILLQKLYLEVIIPQAVYDEILLLEGYEIDLGEFKKADWIQVKNPKDLKMVAQLSNVLDSGESAAIALAIELKADYLAIDERKGREIARSMDLNIIGLIGIIIEAKVQGFINSAKIYFDRLRTEAGFYIKENLYQQILTELGE